MTIKKPMSVKRPTEQAVPPMTADASAPASATIADRFRLDVPEEGAKKKSSGGVASTIAVLAGVAALVVAGILTFVIYQHWEFLQGA
jgi:hypothetical protein